MPLHCSLRSLATFWLAAAATASVLAGETELEEVVVTAELRDEPLMAQAASTSVVDREAVRLRAAQHLEGVLGLMPNVNFAGGTSRARFYQIRGVGERSQFVEPLNPSIGLLIDDIDMSGLGTVGNLFDVEQVEVLRGPQGTLHGANALAGLINIRSAAPRRTAGGYVETSVGEYGTRSLGAAVTGPLGDTLSYRLAANHHRADGFMENAYLGSDRTNRRDETLFRGRLRWEPGADRVDLTLFHANVDNGYDAFSLDNTRTTLSDQPGRDAIQLSALGLNWRRELDTVRLEALASAADSESDYSYDEDWSYVGIAPGWEYSSTDRYLRDRSSYSGQLRLVSTSPLDFGGLPADWVAGIYLLSEDESLRRRYTYLAEDFSSDYETDTTALFGQLDLGLTEGITLSAGLRLAHRATDYRDSNGVSSDPGEQLWGGRLALQYTTEAGDLFYGSVSRGYRANGVNAGIISAPEFDGAGSGLAYFDAELLYNYEIGHKTSRLGGRLMSRLALFYMDRRDQQVKGSLVVPREDGSTAFIDYTDNAATGQNYGLEWEVDWQATERLMLFASLGVLHARFDEYVNADGTNLAGRDQAHAPRYQFAGGAQLEWGGGWYARVEAEGKDRFYFSDRHDVTAPSYVLGHVRVGYATDDWDVALWVRNLGDEDYYIRGFGSFGNDPRKEYALEPYYQYGDPRVIGASLQLRY